MQGEKFVMTWRLDGTLAANKTIGFKLPFAITVVALGAVASNNSDATISLGTLADPDGYLLAKVVGDSGTPVVYDKDDWDGALLPSDHIADVDNLHVAADTVVNIAIDYDGATGTAAQNVDIYLVAIEG